MILRALVVWLLILVLAVINGSVRIAWLIPLWGETAGHIASTLSLCALILLAAWLLIGWIAPASPGEASAVGALWLALTLLFEFGAGHYLFKNSWEKLLLDYNILRGRIWVLVLVVTFFAPLLMSRLRGLFA